MEPRPGLATDETDEDEPTATPQPAFAWSTALRRGKAAVKPPKAPKAPQPTTKDDPDFVRRAHTRALLPRAPRVGAPAGTHSSSQPSSARMLATVPRPRPQWMRRGRVRNLFNQTFPEEEQTLAAKAAAAAAPAAPAAAS